ncbi:MAG: hypothetical protein K2R98_14175 [Gemmataceae bacterium]|nr:hypothetical protein [Gemmataceae bacterium]
MVRTIRWAFLGLLCLTAFGYAADETPKKDPPKEAVKSNEMVIHFHDGTLIRVLAMQENIEVVTKYGKLTVPTTEIRRIEFGLHMPEEITKKVDEGIKDLDSNDFQTREQAGKKLVALGRFSYPALVKASKGTNLETTRRVQDLLKEIRAKFPSYQLKIRTDDVVHTSDFTIAGNISMPNIKVKSDHFGEAQLKLVDLRAMRSAAGSGELEVTVDSTKYGSNPNTWMETDFSVADGIKLSINASGSVDVYAQQPGQYLSGPEGNNQLGRRGLYMPGQLLGRIGENGQVFLIGTRYEGTPKEDGKLYLHIWPFQGGGGSTGSYTVKVASGN